MAKVKTKTSPEGGRCAHKIRTRQTANVKESSTVRKRSTAEFQGELLSTSLTTERTVKVVSKPSLTALKRQKVTETVRRSMKETPFDSTVHMVDLKSEETRYLLKTSVYLIFLIMLGVVPQPQKVELPKKYRSCFK